MRYFQNVLREKQGLWDDYEFCRFLLDASTTMYFTLQLLITLLFSLPSSYLSLMTYGTNNSVYPQVYSRHGTSLTRHHTNMD